MIRGSVGGSAVLRFSAAAILIGLCSWYWRDLPFLLIGNPEPRPPVLIRYLDSDIIRFQGAVAAAGFTYLVLLLLTAAADRVEIDAASNPPPRSIQSFIDVLWGRRLGFEAESRDTVRDDVGWYLDQRRQARSASPTFAVWLLPVLGFIGTVVGISDAIEGLEKSGAGGDAARDFSAVFAGLHVAFDTTLVGLVLAIPLTALLMWLNLRLQSIDQELLSDLAQRTGSSQPGRAGTGAVAVTADQGADK